MQLWIHGFELCFANLDERFLSSYMWQIGMHLRHMIEPNSTDYRPSRNYYAVVVNRSLIQDITSRS